MTRRTTAIATATALAGLAALTLPAPSVSARLGVPGVPTELKIRDSFPAFHGRVRSQVPQCEPDRRVKLFRERRSGSPKLLGRTDSSRSGKWEVLVKPLKSGVYYAKAKRHIVPAARASEFGGVVICEPAFSRRLFVD